MTSVLNGKPDGFISWFAVVCGSWVDTSRASTRRSWVLPEGYDAYPSVHAGNLMAARYLACTIIFK